MIYIEKYHLIRLTGITVLDLLLSLRDEKIMAMYTTKGLDHLGLVAGMFEEIGIASARPETLTI